MNRQIRMKKVIKIVFFLFILVVINEPTLIVLATEEENNTENIVVEELDLGDYSEEMIVGERQLLSVTVLPVETMDKTLTYQSSDKSVATINGLGRIVAIASGTTQITVRCGDKQAGFILTVKEKEEAAIAVTELDLGEYLEEMEIGSRQLLSVTVLPYNATQTAIVYTSSDSSVATINGNGRITAVAIGKTEIKVECGGQMASFLLNVKEKSNDTVAITDIEISNIEDEVKVGKTLPLMATVLPSDATDTVVTFESSNASIATVNSQGIVKGISKGNVTITVSAGYIRKEIKLNVIAATAVIDLNSNYLVLKLGRTFSLCASVSPADAPQAITYKSLDSNIASVSSDGVVSANAIGETTIIVSNGDISVAVSVIVNRETETASKTEKNTSAVDIIDKIQNYNNIVYSFDTDRICEDQLKYLYANNQKLKVVGEGYSFTINGADIENYKNEVLTDIALNISDEDISFYINDGNPLCGRIVLNIDEVEGNYLYMYNESSEKYEKIHVDNLSQIEITSAGRYVITCKEKGERSIELKYTLSGIVIIIASTVCIVAKRRYWFW